MRWRKLESDVRLCSLPEMTRHLDYMSALSSIANLVHGVRVYSLNSCIEKIMLHVRSGRKELGGLLMGRVYQGNLNGDTPAEALTVITGALPSTKFNNSTVSLEMGAEVWCQVPDPAEAGEVVVGWYHSHPDLGAFFSSTDRKTQRAFFNNHYSLGLVVDPYRDELRVYCGADSKEYKYKIIVFDAGLEIAQDQ